MSVRTRATEWDRRNREKWWYVFAQLYLFWGVFTLFCMYAMMVVLLPGLITDLDLAFHVLSVVIFVAAPFTLGAFAVPAGLFALVAVYWRYKRLYQRESNVH